MSFANFGQLKTFLASFAHRSDATTAAMIPDVVKAAESMIAQKVRAKDLLTIVTLDETDRASEGVYNLPADFLGARGIWLDDLKLRSVSLEELRRYGTSASPVQFAVLGTQVEFRGVPITDTEFRLYYFARPASFSADADTNALLVAHPALYIHASLHWLYLFTQDIELSGTHLDAFNATVDEVNLLADRQTASTQVAPHFHASSSGSM